MSIYQEATPEALALSGPHVWPTISATHPIDRFIFRRPELAYLIARRKLDKKRPGADAILIRPALIWHHQGRRKFQAKGKFTHFFLPDGQEDVELFLQQLRNYLKFQLGDVSLMGTSIVLRFVDPARSKDASLKTFQDLWT